MRRSSTRKQHQIDTLKVYDWVLQLGISSTELNLIRILRMKILQIVEKEKIKLMYDIGL